MKKRYIIASVFGVGLIIAILIGMTYVFLEAYTAKGRYTPAVSKTPNSNMNMQGHDMGGSQEEQSIIEDMTDWTQVDMDIAKNTYEHPNIEIVKGTKVTWTNRDAVEHNVMQDHTNSDMAHDATKADNVRDNKFSGPGLMKDQAYSFTFNESGEFEYHCATHPEMRGKITVVG
jgi:amicyanin